MASLCFITTCMGRLAFLKKTLGQVVSQDDSSCVVVDYSCPDRCGEWVEATYPEVRVVRVPGEKTFNRSIAANAGSRAADTPWICLHDCDISFDPRFAEQIIPMLRAGYYYCPEPISDPGLCGTFISSRQDFERIGGYDEIYRGWGERDLDVYCALEYIGLKRNTFPSGWLHHIPHGDDLRVKHQTNKHRDLGWCFNRIYRFAKFDIMYVTGEELPLNLRELLYEEIAQKAERSIIHGTQFGLAIDIEGRGLILTYDICQDPAKVSTMTKIYQMQPEFMKRLYRMMKQSFKFGGIYTPDSKGLTDLIYRRFLPLERRLEVGLLSQSTCRQKTKTVQLAGTVREIAGVSLETLRVGELYKFKKESGSMP